VNLHWHAEQETFGKTKCMSGCWKEEGKRKRTGEVKNRRKEGSKPKKDDEKDDESKKGDAFVIQKTKK